MRIEFAKLNGLGNDFIMIDDRVDGLNVTAEEVKRLCDRHFGIGADGVIVVKPSPRPECSAYMHYINSDGSLAQMCGNGVRCFAKYLVDRAIVDPRAGAFVADTLAGPRPIRFKTDERGKLTRARVAMGAPVLTSEEIPVNAPADALSADGRAYVGDLSLESPWGTFSFICVSMGNPHAVCFVDDWKRLPDSLFADKTHKSLQTLRLDEIGAYFESHKEFPERINVEFAQKSADGLAMRVFERGCGETLACGTGACAVEVAAVLSGRAGRASQVKLAGGVLDIEWADDGQVYLSGPAAESFTGLVDLQPVS